MIFRELYLICKDIAESDVFSLFINGEYIGEFSADEIYHHFVYGCLRIISVSIHDGEIKLG